MFVTIVCLNLSRWAATQIDFLVSDCIADYTTHQGNQSHLVFDKGESNFVEMYHSHVHRLEFSGYYSAIRDDSVKSVKSTKPGECLGEIDFCAAYNACLLRLRA